MAKVRGRARRILRVKLLFIFGTVWQSGSDRLSTNGNAIANVGADLDIGEIPLMYTAGLERGRQVDAVRANTYVAHTMVGDPLADEMVADLAVFGREESSRLLQLMMDQEDHPDLRWAPDSMKRFFAEVEEVPSWVDTEAFMPAYRMFHRNIGEALGGLLAGSLVEGFSTNIALSFFITGRLRHSGGQRLRRNNRHLAEIFLPGGLDRQGDGWKLSVRLRVVHATVRRLLAESDDWDVPALGTPISSAHLGFSLTAFSARMVRHMKKLGARFNDEERDAFMAVWRYTGHLMGIPEAMLFRDEDDANAIFEIGVTCEPETPFEAAVVASSLLNSAPILAGYAEPEARRQYAQFVFNISRELIGRDMAERLRFPKTQRFGTVWGFRLQNRINALRSKVDKKRRLTENNVLTMLAVAIYDEDNEGIYRMPDNVYAEEGEEW